MPEHKIGSREEWQAARDELAGLEAEHAKRNEEIKANSAPAPAAAAWATGSTARSST